MRKASTSVECGDEHPSYGGAFLVLDTNMLPISHHLLGHETAVTTSTSWLPADRCAMARVGKMSALSVAQTTNSSLPSRPLIQSASMRITKMTHCNDETVASIECLRSVLCAMRCSQSAAVQVLMSVSAGPRRQHAWPYKALFRSATSQLSGGHAPGQSAVR